MRTADIGKGAEVYVILPYDGGRGWATVVEPRARPGRGHAAATVRIEFLPREAPAVLVRERLVRPADVFRAREPGWVLPGRWAHVRYVGRQHLVEADDDPAPATPVRMACGARFEGWRVWHGAPEPHLPRCKRCEAAA